MAFRGMTLHEIACLASRIGNFSVNERIGGAFYSFERALLRRYGILCKAAKRTWAVILRVLLALW